MSNNRETVLNNPTWQFVVSFVDKCNEVKEFEPANVEYVCERLLEKLTDNENIAGDKFEALDLALSELKKSENAFSNAVAAYLEPMRAKYESSVSEKEEKHVGVQEWIDQNREELKRRMSELQMKSKMANVELKETKVQNNIELNSEREAARYNKEKNRLNVEVARENAKNSKLQSNINSQVAENEAKANIRQTTAEISSNRADRRLFRSKGLTDRTKAKESGKTLKTEAEQAGQAKRTELDEKGKTDLRKTSWKSRAALGRGRQAVAEGASEVVGSTFSTVGSVAKCAGNVIVNGVKVVAAPITTLFKAIQLGFHKLDGLIQKAKNSNSTAYESGQEY